MKTPFGVCMFVVPTFLMHTYNVSWGEEGLLCPFNSLLKCQGQERLNPEGQYGKFYNFLQMLSVCKVKVMLIFPF